MLATRFLCRLLMPWMLNACSRVRLKLSGEVTTIQYWTARPPPPPPPPALPFPPRRRLRAPGDEAAELSEGLATSTGCGSALGSASVTGALGRRATLPAALPRVERVPGSDPAASR